MARRSTGKMDSEDLRMNACMYEYGHRIDTALSVCSAM
jgi:hypothetical protein